MGRHLNQVVPVRDSVTAVEVSKLVGLVEWRYSESEEERGARWIWDSGYTLAFVGEDSCLLKLRRRDV